ncbi:MAG: S-layer family protein [Calothrix sp. MO_167.B12]|nr:S-layer family protein [Calothrix sp. MO_167.B12]
MFALHSLVGWCAFAVRWFLWNIAVYATFWVNSANAQITPDTSLLGNEASTVTPNVNIKGLPADRIDGGATRGANLFHSFSEFNVRDAQRVYFANPTGVENILTRVTGGKVSNILGTLGVNGSANLFFVNPSGILFGENARLDVGGSFVGTTANGIEFGEGDFFSATNPQTPSLLTINVPIGLQFRGTPRTIVVQGNGQGLRNRDAPVIDTNDALRVGSNQTLALVGGNLVLSGATLKTAGGRIELGSVGDNGKVNLNAVENGFVLGYENISQFGEIQLSAAAAVDSSGNNGGEIQIQGKFVTLKDGSQIEATTLGNATGGKLQVFASELLEVSGSTADNPQDNRRNPSSLATDNRENGQIPGELTINTKRFVVRNGARISASNLLGGVGGNINVKTSESVELTGTGRSSGGLRSSGLSVQTRGDGPAGNLIITTKRLSIKDGAEASASTFGAGGGGNLEVNVSETLLLQGTSANGQLRSRLVAEVGDPREIRRRRDTNPVTPATGKGGNLLVNTNLLTVRDGATVTVSSRTNARNAQGAGNININAQRIQLNNQGSITAETFSGEGGNITLKLQEILLLRRNNRISTTAGTTATGGDGGNININSPFIVAFPQENSDITANAFSGSGGKIDITTQAIFGLVPRSREELQTLLSTSNPTELNPNQLSSNDITAISQENPSLSGQVFINTPDVDPSQGLSELPENIVDAAGLINQNLCTAARQGSEFIVTGQGGLPVSPSELLNPHATWEDWSMGIQQKQSQPKPGKPSNKLQTKSESSPPIIEARGWVLDGHGNVMLTAKPVTVTRQGTWLHPLDCQRLTVDG